MQHGLRVRLNPGGGNQLNIREALRLLNPPKVPDPGTDNESDSSDVGDAEAREPRRTAPDDYDYDDDFIDDGDLVEEEQVPPTPPSEEEDDPPTASHPPSHTDPSANPDSSPATHRRQLTSHGFTSFYASRGSLPSRSTVDNLALGEKSLSKIGNVTVDFPPAAQLRLQQLNTANGTYSSDHNQNPPSPANGPSSAIPTATPTPKSSENPVPGPPAPDPPATKEKSSLSTKRPNASADADANTDPATASGGTAAISNVDVAKENTSAPQTGPTTANPSGIPVSSNGRKSPSTSAEKQPALVASLNPTPKQPSSAVSNGTALDSETKSTALIPVTVTEEIDKLSTLCESKFGDKKPKLDDPRVQEQLCRMLITAIDAGVARLYNDIQKDKRVVSLNDELWKSISRFLRAKRLDFEMLGHDVLWSARERDAKSAVDSAEKRITELVTVKKSKLPESTTLASFSWDPDVDMATYEWYKAKKALQEAKNQLGSRFKTVKKSVGAWVASLRKQAFNGWSIADNDISDAIHRVEDKIAAERLERNEKKRKHEEINSSEVVSIEDTPPVRDTTSAVATKKPALDNTATKAAPKRVSSVIDTENAKSITRKAPPPADGASNGKPTSKKLSPVSETVSGIPSKYSVRKSASTDGISARSAQRRASGNVNGSSSKAGAKKVSNGAEGNGGKTPSKGLDAPDGVTGKPTSAKRLSGNLPAPPAPKTPKNPSTTSSSKGGAPKRISSSSSRSSTTNTSKVAPSGTTAAGKKSNTSASKLSAGGTSATPKKPSATTSKPQTNGHTPTPKKSNSTTGTPNAGNTVKGSKNPTAATLPVEKVSNKTVTAPKTGAGTKTAAGQTAEKGTKSLTKSSNNPTRAATSRSAPAEVKGVAKTITKPKNQNKKPNNNSQGGRTQSTT